MNKPTTPMTPPAVPALNPELEAAVKLVTPDHLRGYLTDNAVRATMQDFEENDIDCPLEIIVMASALRDLAETTRDHASDLDADEMTLSADAARSRAHRYQASYETLKQAWT